MPHQACPGKVKPQTLSTGVIQQGLEGREAVAVVVDDSSAVWPSHERNLLKVERYHYFPSSRRQFGLRGGSLLELGRFSAPPPTPLMQCPLLVALFARTCPGSHVLGVDIGLIDNPSFW